MWLIVLVRSFDGFPKKGTYLKLLGIIVCIIVQFCAAGAHFSRKVSIFSKWSSFDRCFVKIWIGWINELELSCFLGNVHKCCHVFLLFSLFSFYLSFNFFLISHCNFSGYSSSYPYLEIFLFCHILFVSLSIFLFLFLF